MRRGIDFDAFTPYFRIDYDSFMKNSIPFNATVHAASPPVVAHQLKTLQKHIAGEVLSDSTSRWMYSTDASIYQHLPDLIVVPRTAEDLKVTLDFAHEHHLPITPRGGGTSLGGQAIGPGIQLDFSKYLNRIVEVDLQAGWVRVQPGVVLEHLNQQLAPHDFWFGPDVAPTNRATLGGMIGNNSAGARSILYGKTLDHVLALETLWSDGRVSWAGELSPEDWDTRSQQSHCEGRLLKLLTHIEQHHTADIQAAFPKILRRVSGYNLDAFVATPPGQPLNLAHLLVGSEGTLAVWQEAQLKIVPKPTHSALLVLYFDTVSDALEANHAMLETHPSAAELIDDMLLALTRENAAFARKLHFMAYAAPVILVVQYLADSASELTHKVQKGIRFAQQQGLSQRYSVATDPRTQSDIWAIRKAGMPLLYSMPGDHKPITFIEDTAVAPERLRAFIEDFDALIQAHDTRAAYYAHASVGCLHIRPLIDLKQVSEVKKMRSLAEGVVHLVRQYHGAMSGEHGDGLARSEFNEALFGPTVYGLFKAVKAAADPQQLMNPGKITDAPPMDQNLRYGAFYQPQHLKGFLQDVTGKQSVNHLIEQCNGCGACRKSDVGTMCPPFRVTGQEADSTRGRANTLRRLLLAPELLRDPTTQGEIKAVMETCIGCKACKAECPSQVDMARLKSEYLHRQHQLTGIPLRSQLFGHLKWLNHLGALTAPLSNGLLRLKPVRRLLERTVGIAASVPLPTFARVPFDFRFHQRPSPNGERPPVILFNDCYMNYNHPEVGEAAVKVIEALGYQVIVPEQVCCGRPQLSLGLLAQAKKSAENLWTQLEPYLHPNRTARAGEDDLEPPIPVIGIEPSCVISFADEYPGLSSPSYQDISQRLARQSILLQDWLLSVLAERQQQGLPLPFRAASWRVFFHEHCHQKAWGNDQGMALLQQIPGLEVLPSRAGCCGMAGSFGYEAEHAPLSQAIAQKELLPALSQAHGQKPVDKIGVSGMSCRHQIQNQKPTDIEPKVQHWIEILAELVEVA